MMTITFMQMLHLKCHAKVVENLLHLKVVMFNKYKQSILKDIKFKQQEQ